jgi:hypothetical protein
MGNIIYVTNTRQRIFFSTEIAKLIFTPTRHVIASISFFNPKFTRRTLFILSSFYKLNKRFVILIKNSINTKLFTAHSLMVNNFTFQTINLFTDRTIKLRLIFIKTKHILTPWSWTPRHIFLILVYIVFKA